MSRKYSGETREIVADFLRALEERGDIDPYFLGELKRLAEAGSLGISSKVKQAVRILEARSDDDED